MKMARWLILLIGLSCFGCAHVKISAPDGSALESCTVLKDVELPRLRASKQEPDGTRVEFSAEGLSSKEKFTKVLQQLEETAQALLKSVQALQAAVP